MEPSCALQWWGGFFSGKMGFTAQTHIRSVKALWPVRTASAHTHAHILYRKMSSSFLFFHVSCFTFAPQALKGKLSWSSPAHLQAHHNKAAFPVWSLCVRLVYHNISSVFLQAELTPHQTSWWALWRTLKSNNYCCNSGATDCIHDNSNNKCYLYSTKCLTEQDKNNYKPLIKT